MAAVKNKKLCLLITGVSGFLGWNLAKKFSKNYEIFGVWLSKEIAIPGTKCIKTDITNLKELNQLFEMVKPDLVIHCAAMSKPDECEINRDLSYRVNVLSSRWIAELSANSNSKLVFTSTDLVFDGETGNYSENCNLNPQSVYAEHKVRAELDLQTIYPQTTICRCPLMFGLAPSTADNQLPILLKQLADKQDITLFWDQFRSMASADSVSNGLLIGLNNPGIILHLGGKQRISRYQFGIEVAQAAGYPDTMIKQNSMFDNPVSAIRPRDVSLNSSKAFSLGYKPDLVSTALSKIL